MTTTALTIGAAVARGIDETRFWRRIEGSGEPELQDARHWVNVYSELLATLRAMRESGLGETDRIGTLIRVFEGRQSFWSSVLLESPVREARVRRAPRAAGRSRHSA